MRMDSRELLSFLSIGLFCFDILLALASLEPPANQRNRLQLDDGFLTRHDNDDENIPLNRLISMKFKFCP